MKFSLRYPKKQIVCEGAGSFWKDIKTMEHMAKHEAAEPKQVVVFNPRISLVTFLDIISSHILFCAQLSGKR